MEFIRKKVTGQKAGSGCAQGLQAEQKGQVLYLTFPSFTRTQAVAHLFSTRLGGVSEGIFSSMNLSYTRGDKKEAVDENYRRIADILGCGPEAFVCSDQTHTTNIRKVTESDCGKGVTIPRDYQDVDGLVTDRAGIVLATFFADCVPLYFLDGKRRVIGLAHSGWRGTVGRIGKKMIDIMTADYGCKRENILAAIGPSICADCYEVSEDVAAQFEAEFGSVVLRAGKEAGKYQLDLWRANEEVLLQAGLTPAQIEVTDICTCCNSSLLFSHRASKGKRGNMGAFLMLKQG